MVRAVNRAMSRRLPASVHFSGAETVAPSRARSSRTSASCRSGSCSSELQRIRAANRSRRPPSLDSEDGPHLQDGGDRAPVGPARRGGSGAPRLHGRPRVRGPAAGRVAIPAGHEDDLLLCRVTGCLRGFSGAAAHQGEGGGPRAGEDEDRGKTAHGIENRSAHQANIPCRRAPETRLDALTGNNGVGQPSQRGHYGNRFTCVPRETPYRVARPKKSRIDGPQLARWIADQHLSSVPSAACSASRRSSGNSISSRAMSNWRATTSGGTP